MDEVKRIPDSISSTRSTIITTPTRSCHFTGNLHIFDCSSLIQSALCSPLSPSLRSGRFPDQDLNLSYYINLTTPRPCFARRHALFLIKDLQLQALLKKTGPKDQRYSLIHIHHSARTATVKPHPLRKPRPTAQRKNKTSADPSTQLRPPVTRSHQSSTRIDKRKRRRATHLIWARTSSYHSVFLLSLEYSDCFRLFRIELSNVPFQS